MDAVLFMKMELIGERVEIYAQLQKDCPDVSSAIQTAWRLISRGKQEVYPFQAAALYLLAGRFNYPGAKILEIGTYYGFTAAIMAQAAPLAKITTINPLEWEVDNARKRLSKKFDNIEFVCRHSWDYLAEYDGTPLDFVFIDGDHKRVKLDFPWWNHLKVGGIKFHHDYSPNGSDRACPPVYRAIKIFEQFLGRDADIMVIDELLVGMAGFVKQIDDPDWIAQNDD
jgi:predicted O-methyltransferase YrrM